MAADAAYGKRPRPPAWYHYAGLIAALSGNLEAALAMWNAGVATHPHCAILHNDLAAGYERRGRTQDAITAAERAAVEEPALPQVHKNLGDLHYRNARYDDALECYQRTIRIRSDLGSDVYLKAGNIRYRRGEREEAARYWQHALELAPDNAAARNNLELAKRLP
jgi:tetratricopeptide (TPR) repeat protein